MIPPLPYFVGDRVEQLISGKYMDFSNSTTEIGLIQEVDRICNTTDNTYSLKAKTARLNAGLDRFCFLALENDRTWQFDDLNHTDLPIGTTDLVSGQYDYEFADELLVVQRVMVKNSSGDWCILKPRDMDDPDSDYMWTKPTTHTGLPTHYQKFAHSLLIDPTPDYNSTDGLKVVFKRNCSKFVSTDTTTDPGIPEIFHTYLARYAALPFLIEKNLPQAQGIAMMIAEDEKSIKEYFGLRGQDEKTRLTPNVEDTR